MPNALLLSYFLSVLAQDPPAVGSQTAEPAGTGIELPESAARATWAAVASDTVPAVFPAEWSALRAAEPWTTAAGWELWAKLLAEEAHAPAADPARRAALAVLAARQGRSDAAWGHFVKIGEAPPWQAAAMPALFPGVASAAGAGGLPAPLPADVLLSPCLPPPTVDPETGAITWTKATVHELEVGGAKLSLVMALDPTGVEIDLQHLSGPTARLFVRLPSPADFEISVEYIDWQRQETHGEPLEVKLVPGAEPVVLWGRFEERMVDLPGVRAGPLPAQVREGGLWLVVAEGVNAGARSDPLLDRFARLASDLLGVGVHIAERTPEASTSWTGTILHVPREGRAAWLARLAGAIEIHLLGDPNALGAQQGSR
jgi:hypothetical protein